MVHDRHYQKQDQDVSKHLMINNYLLFVLSLLNLFFKVFGKFLNATIGNLAAILLFAAIVEYCTQNTSSNQISQTAHVLAMTYPPIYQSE